MYFKEGILKSQQDKIRMAILSSPSCLDHVWNCNQGPEVAPAPQTININIFVKGIFCCLLMVCIKFVTVYSINNDTSSTFNFREDKKYEWNLIDKE